MLYFLQWNLFKNDEKYFISHVKSLLKLKIKLFSFITWPHLGHVISGSYDFAYGSLLWQVTTLPSLLPVPIGLLQLEIQCICHKTSISCQKQFQKKRLIAKRYARLKLTRSHETKWLKGHATLWMKHLTAYHRPEKFGDHRYCDSGDSMLLIFYVASY